MGNREGWRRIRVVLLCLLAAYAVIRSAPAVYEFAQYAADPTGSALWEAACPERPGEIAIRRVERCYDNVQSLARLQLVSGLVAGLWPLSAFLLYYALFIYALRPVYRWVKAGFRPGGAG